MSGHDANPIFFNKKKIKSGLPEHSLPSNQPTSNNISFLPYPHPSPTQSKCYMTPNDTPKHNINKYINYMIINL